MNPSQAMGTFLRTRRSEWASLSRAQLAIAILTQLPKRKAVTTKVIRKWEEGQPPNSTEGLEALCRTMRRHALSQPEVEQFRQSVFAACVDRQASCRRPRNRPPCNGGSFRGCSRFSRPAPAGSIPALQSDRKIVQAFRTRPSNLRHMLARVESATIVGIEAQPVVVEVYVSRGKFAFEIVGLPDIAAKEGRERVKAAVRNSQYFFPGDRTTINLAPADIKKEGPSFDLPVAIGVLAATGQLQAECLDKCCFTGELSLDGSVRSVNGVLPMTLRARADGKERMLVPRANAREAAVVDGIETYAVDCLYDAATMLENEFAGVEPVVPSPEDLDLEHPPYGEDMGDVKGQPMAKRALEVCAAGGHNAIMVGPPGAGKTMLARRLPTIMPPLSRTEALEITQVYSISGKLRGGSLIRIRPFRSPHHTVSEAGLVGGGSTPTPGEISLAHRGVLFMDELPEFSRGALEALRQPMEDGMITISRAQAAYTYPANLMVVAAMNPCPCGHYTDSLKPCTCTPHQIRKYLARISGPLLDRIDIHVEVPRLAPDELEQFAPSEPSDAIRDRVRLARGRQAERFAGTGMQCNADMTSAAVREFCKLTDDVASLLRAAVDQFGLSARAYDRILKVSRTIADLEGAESLLVHHVAEAVQYRSLDRKLWA